MEPEAATAAGERAVAAIAREHGTLRTTAAELGRVLRESNREIDRLASDFEPMAQATHEMLESAAGIVGCGQGERMLEALAGVQQLGVAAGRFLHQRMEATAGIVETVTAEAAVLARLTQLTNAQKAIVKETAMLRVLTNIEVARLGEVGTGFEYLAHELDDFATAVAHSIAELDAHTEERRAEVDMTRRTLSAELPRLREEFTQLESGLDNARMEVDATFAHLTETPARFQACVEEVAQQIAGVVAAIQAHDITRQQMEHVEAALTGMAKAIEAGGGASEEMRAGLTIQSYQMQSIRATIESWTGQIRSCLDGIERLAASEILALGRGVLEREREVAAELARVEQLEERCAAENAKVEASLAGITGLMQLVSEHLTRSRGVRERLQLLMFNSIVEASHLGTQADGILEISNTIKRLSAAWSAITQQSESAMREIGALVERSRATMEGLSGEAQEGLREAQAQTSAGLAVLREAAACAERRGGEIVRHGTRLQGRVTEVRATGERLETSFRQLGQILEEIEGEGRDAGSDRGGWDTAALEARFGATYTTETERAVLRAALGGGPLPAAQQNFAGNSVELF